MKISKAVSEKRTYRTMSDEYISREFSAGREIEVPDSLPTADRQVLELELTLDLRKEVLMAFVLEGQVSQDEYAKTVETYNGLLAAAKQGQQG